MIDRILPSLLLCLVSLAPLRTASADSLPIETGNALTITFKGIPTQDISAHNGLYRVDDQGFIKMPYLEKRILAKGMTVSRLERTIMDLYRSARIYPEATVTIQKSGDEREPRITIIGKRAGKPGQYPFARGMTLAAAVGIAAPNKFFQGQVHLMRGGKTLKLDIDEAASKSLLLRPGDIIELVK